MNPSESPESKLFITSPKPSEIKLPLTIKKAFKLAQTKIDQTLVEVASILGMEHLTWCDNAATIYVAFTNSGNDGLLIGDHLIQYALQFLSVVKEIAEYSDIIVLLQSSLKSSEIGVLLVTNPHVPKWVIYEGGLFMTTMVGNFGTAFGQFDSESLDEALRNKPQLLETDAYVPDSSPLEQANVPTPMRVKPQRSKISLADLCTAKQNPMIRINVGGRIFSTTMKTLESRGPNALSKLMTSFLAKEIEIVTDDQGIPFIDRDPDVFAVILEYLRSGVLALRKNVTRKMVVVEFAFLEIDDSPDMNESSSDLMPSVQRTMTKLKKETFEVSQKAERWVKQNLETFTKFISQAALMSTYEELEFTATAWDSALQCGSRLPLTPPRDLKWKDCHLFFEYVAAVLRDLCLIDVTVSFPIRSSMPRFAVIMVMNWSSLVLGSVDKLWVS